VYENLQGGPGRRKRVSELTKDLNRTRPSLSEVTEQASKETDKITIVTNWNAWKSLGSDKLYTDRANVWGNRLKTLLKGKLGDLEAEYDWRNN
jgi:hypothetical protein